jgi:hypothetical protein
MSCKYELCKDWSWNGCGWAGVHDFSGSIDGIVWTCNGGCCNGVTSYSTHGDRDACENTQLIAYEKPGYKGHSQPMRGYNKRVDREWKSGCNDDWWSSIKETKIPRTMSGKLPRQDTDAECPGATNTYKKVAGKKNACFYSNSDAAAIQKVYDQKTGNNPMSSLFTQLKTEFCSRSENVFKNPGGGICLEYDTNKNIAKEYCSVDDRISKDANCTKDNLGNHYETLAETYCKTATGKADPWCSCYNVSNDVCKSNPSAAGCAKKKQVFDPLVKATPEKFRHVWSGKAKCFGGVCVGKKYVPTNANQGCDAPVQICAQSFDVSNISESTIEAKCEQTSIQNNSSSESNTQPSAGDSPSGGTPSGGTPSGGTPSGGTPSGGTPSGNAVDFDNLTDQEKIIIGVILLLALMGFFSMIF